MKQFKENTWEKYRQSLENHIGIDAFLLDNICSKDFKFKNDRRKFGTLLKKRSNSLDFEKDGPTRYETQKFLKEGKTSKSIDLEDADSVGSSKNLSEEDK